MNHPSLTVYLNKATSIFVAGLLLLSNLFGSSATATGVFKVGWELLPEAYTNSVDSGDIDGDGDNDLVITRNPYSLVKVYTNDGAGQLNQSSVSFGFPASVTVQLIDLDSDGDVDGAITQETGKAGVWLNDGSGQFTKTSQELGSTNVSGFVLSDVNGDTHMDILLRNSSGLYEVWVNTGAANFLNSGDVIGSGFVSNLKLGDFDNDSDSDAWVSQTEIGDRVWLNNGAGAFTDSGVDYGPLDVAPYDVDVGDVDGDLDIDVYTAYGNRYSSEVGGQVPDILWINDGASNFVAEHQGTGASQISLIDLNLDGFVDRALASGYSPNDGSGNFTGAWQGFGTTRTGGYVFSNLNGNIAPDLYQGNMGYDNVWLNDGSGGFSDTGQRFGSNAVRNFELGDVDGDGDLDAWYAGYNGQPHEVWLNDGTGGYINSGQEIYAGDSEAVSLGDLDGDNDLDAWIGGATGVPHSIWLNNGDGVFSDSGQTLTVSGFSNFARDVELGDVDGDGDLDAWVSGYIYDANRIWLNDGSGNFSDSGQVIGYTDYTNHTRAIGLGDLDGDGDLDAYLANSFYIYPNEVWLNNGSGVYSNTGQSLGLANSLDITLADIDGDTDLDAFVANYSGPNKVWINDGSGTFSDSGQLLGNSNSQSVDIGDVNNDGFPDAWIANLQPHQANKVWLNNGSGMFVDSQQNLGQSESTKIQLGDLNGDGKLDSMVSNYGGDSRVWLNMDNSCSTSSPLLTDGPYVDALYCGADTQITAGPLVLEAGADVTFYAPLVKLTGGFRVLPGAAFNGGYSPLVDY